MRIIMRQCCLFSSLSSRYNEVLLSVSRLVKAPTQIPFVESSDVYAPKAPSYEVTKLPNGVTVMTESVIVPSTAHIGIFVDAGTRDETPESSGSSLLLKNVCLKTMINTNETVNYGAFQMAGGNFEMDYTRESIYFRGSCLAHDFIDIVSIAADCAFEPRSVVAVNVGMYKNNQALLL